LRRIRATTNPNFNSRYHLKGKAKINNNNSSQPYVALITWNLFDSSGNSQGTKVMGVPGSLSDWSFGSPVTLAAIGKAAPEIISNLINYNNSLKKIKDSVVKTKLIGVWVNQVTNAPADGNKLLTLAIKKVIHRDGFTLAEMPRSAKFFLDGNVSVSLSKNGFQQVEIVWKLSSSDNNEVGQVSQKNMVKAGMYSKTWGKDSLLIAKAAMRGIKGLLKHDGFSKIQLNTPRQKLKIKYPSASKKLILPPPSLDLEGLK